MGTLRTDLRYALRSLARRPGFAAVVAVTLALGIGATTAIFSVVDAVLLRPLPWPAAERMVVLGGRTADGERAGLSYPDFLAIRAGVGAFEEVGAVRGQSVNLTGVERPDRLFGTFVTASVLRLVGAGAALGRPFTDAETELGSRAPVVMLSHATWRTRFGGDPRVVGRTLTLNGVPFTVVGVADSGATIPGFAAPEVWLPLPYYPNAGGFERDHRSFEVAARLRPGASREVAATQLAAVMRREAEQFPATNAGITAIALDLREALVRDARRPLVLVMGAVAVLLLIACLNVANLQLARAIARQRETAMRAALGAGRARIARQILTESLVLAALGGVLGVVLGKAMLELLVLAVAADLPAYRPITIDGRVLALAAAVTAAAGAVAGLFPVWQAARAGAGALGARDASATRGAMRGRGALVVGQMALSVVLLAVAGLLAHSLLELRRVAPGFDPRDLLTFEFRLPPAKYDAPEKIADMFTRALAEMRAVPGVRSAALVRAVPFGGNMETFPTAFDGRPLDDPARALEVHVNVVSDGYFATVGLPLRTGRDFDPRDDATAPRVAVVSEELARRAWPGESPIGKRLRAQPWGPDDWATVVGVVAGAKHLDLAEPLRPQAYVHYRQFPLIFTSVAVRTVGDPLALAEPVRRAVWRVDPDQPMWKLRSMEQMLAGSVGDARALASLTAAFALVALTLAAVGVFGVMSFAVAQRRRELGIRIALGAPAGQVTGMVVRHGLRLTGAALALGLAGALGAGRLLAGQLYGVTPGDPATLGAVAVLLAGVALVASWVPARRAGRVDPKVSLQAE